MTTQATPRQMLFFGFVAGGAGVYFILVGLAMLPIPGGPTNLHGPLWIVLCVGLAFLLASLALIVQALGHADATGELPPSAPRWMRLIQWLIGVAIFSCFGLIGSCVAFAPGKRAFSGSFLFFSHETNELIGRSVFGFGAVIVWLSTIAFAVYGLRRIMRPRP